jgi:hypothetical protein
VTASVRFPRHRRKAVAGILAVLALAACTHRKPAGGDDPAPAHSSSDGSADSVAITLSRTACFGRCPIYTVRLGGSGRVNWHGERFVAAMGDSTSSVAPAGVRSLARRMEQAGFFAFRDRYAMGDSAAEPCHTDAPHALITLTIGARTKAVEHDYGCRGAPAALRAIAAQIDSVAGTAKWVGPR